MPQTADHVKETGGMQVRESVPPEHTAQSKPADLRDDACYPHLGVRSVSPNIRKSVQMPYRSLRRRGFDALEGRSASHVAAPEAH